MLHPLDGPGLKFHAEYNLMRQMTEVWVVADKTIGQVEMVERGKERPDMPTLALQYCEAQGLFDALWEIGYRPKETANVNDVIAAKDGHIADLRQILSAYLRKTND